MTNNKYYCPICGHSSNEFLDHNNDMVIKNTVCPSCKSYERHRLLWIFLNKEIDLSTKKLKILYIAPENCLYNELNKIENISIITANILGKNVDINFNLINIPFNDNVFDLILCNHVLEHVKNDRKAMSELYRIMKPDGLAILTIPYSTQEKTIEEPLDQEYTLEKRLKLFGKQDHVRTYSLLDFENRLTEVGFKVYPISYGKMLSKELVEKYNLYINHVIHCCSKNKEL